MKNFSPQVVLRFLLISVLIFMFTACNSMNNDTENETVPFSHGVINDNKYESALLGIGLILEEEGWRFATDEELAKANGLDEMTDEALKEALSNKKYIYDMMAEKKNEGGADSVTLSFPNTEEYGLEGMNEAEFAEATIKGVFNATAVIETVKLGDKEHSSIKLVGKTNGKDYYQRMIFVEKNGYMGMITVTCLSENDLNRIISGFYTL